MCCQNFILNFLSGRKDMSFRIHDSLSALQAHSACQIFSISWLLLPNIFLTELLLNLEWNRRNIFCTSEIKYNETQPLCKLHWQGSEMRWHTNQAQSCRCYYSISIPGVISWIKQCLCKSCNTQIFHTEEYV